MEYSDVIHPHRKEIAIDNVEPCIPHVAKKCAKMGQLAKQ
jgi:hypothetical protein